MKTIKINKRDYTDYEYLLRRVGAVSKDGENGLPQHVYWNTSDLIKSRNLLIKAYKKEYKHLSHDSLMFSLAMYILNLAPNKVGGSGLKPGYMLIDEKGIQNEKENAKK